MLVFQHSDLKNKFRNVGADTLNIDPCLKIKLKTVSVIEHENEFAVNIKKSGSFDPEILDQDQRRQRNDRDLRVL